MDRLHPLYKSELVANKKVVFIYVGGGNENGTLFEMHNSIKGFVKYLKLDIVCEFSFKALENKDVVTQKQKIKEIIGEIKSKLKEVI